MQSALANLTYEIELKEGETFSFPDEIMKRIKAGKWLVSIRPTSMQSNGSATRGHGAFLSSYAEADEGLYDDCTARRVLDWSEED